MSRLSGTVTLSGSAVSGATVYVVDTDSNSVVATETTDANGDWEATGLANSAQERYHALVQYDDGNTKYNAESLPFLSTPGIIEPGASDVGVASPTPGITASSQVPDSTIHNWRFDEGSGTTAADNVGSADGTINGATWESGTWAGSSALNGDGADDHVSTTALGNFGSANGTSHAVAVTVQTTTSDLSTLFGVNDGNVGSAAQFHVYRINENTGGDIELNTTHQTNGDNLQVRTGDVSINDGNPHRIVYNVVDTTSNTVEIWLDGVEQSITTASSGSPSNYGDYTRPFYILAQNNGGSTVQPLNGIADNPLVTSNSLTSQEIQDDYNAQPWS